MLISTKGRYALHLLVDMAEHDGQDNFIPLKEVAERQEISEKYLEAIVKMLVQNKLLVGLRGKGGGYRLVKAPEEYSVGEVIRITEGDLAVVACLADDSGECPKRAACRTVGMWEKFDNLINNFFDNITVADLMDTKIAEESRAAAEPADAAAAADTQAAGRQTA